jgi:hypothetical protein
MGKTHLGATKLGGLGPPCPRQDLNLQHSGPQPQSCAGTYGD